MALPDAIYPQLKRIEVPRPPTWAWRSTGRRVVAGRPAGRAARVQPVPERSRRSTSRCSTGARRRSTTRSRRRVPWVQRHARPRAGSTSRCGPPSASTGRARRRARPRCRITVTGAGGASVVVQAVGRQPGACRPVKGFVEANGYVSMEADHYTQAVKAPASAGSCCPDIGRTGDGMTPSRSRRRPDAGRRQPAAGVHDDARSPTGPVQGLGVPVAAEQRAADRRAQVRRLDRRRRRRRS